jgi:hypothetical protein
MASEVRIKGAFVRLTPASLQHLDKVTRSQIPFAETRALTIAAQTGLKYQRRFIALKFNIRNKNLLGRWRAASSKKGDWPRLKAKVGTPDKLWLKQEKGGRQKPRGKTFTIPTRIMRSRRKGNGAIPKALRPRAAIAGGKAFAERETIRSKAKRGQLAGKTLYLRRKSVQIEPDLKARENITRVAAAKFRKVFPRVLGEAVQSRKVKT